LRTVVDTETISRKLLPPGPSIASSRCACSRRFERRVSSRSRSACCAVFSSSEVLSSPSLAIAASSGAVLALFVLRSSSSFSVSGRRRAGAASTFSLFARLRSAVSTLHLLLL